MADDECLALSTAHPSADFYDPKFRQFCLIFNHNFLEIMWKAFVFQSFLNKWPIQSEHSSIFQTLFLWNLFFAKLQWNFNKMLNFRFGGSILRKTISNEFGQIRTNSEKTQMNSDNIGKIWTSSDKFERILKKNSDTFEWTKKNIRTNLNKFG